MQQLPVLLADGAPGIAGRLCSNPFRTEDEAEEWDRNSAPELRHLFASARSIVLEDLEGLEREPDALERFRLRIPGEHITAWLSALAAARVALGESHEVNADDMSAPPPTAPESGREYAILLIQLLGWLQAVLID
jgi:hypothetical protein